MLHSQVLGFRISTYLFGAHNQPTQCLSPFLLPISPQGLVATSLPLAFIWTSLTALTTLEASALHTYTLQSVGSPGEQWPLSFPFSILVFALLGTLPGA